MEAQNKKVCGGTRAFREALLCAQFTENSYEDNLQSFLYDQVEELNFRKKISNSRNFIFDSRNFIFDSRKKTFEKQD